MRSNIMPETTKARSISRGGNGGTMRLFEVHHGCERGAWTTLVWSIEIGEWREQRVKAETWRVGKVCFHRLSNWKREEEKRRGREKEKRNYFWTLENLKRSTRPRRGVVRMKLKFVKIHYPFWFRFFLFFFLENYLSWNSVVLSFIRYKRQDGLSVHLIKRSEWAESTSAYFSDVLSLLYNFNHSPDLTRPESDGSCFCFGMLPLAKNFPSKRYIARNNAL